MVKVNPLRGEAAFRVGAETWKLLIDVNAFCEIEADTGLGVNALIQEIQKNPSFTTVRAVICGMLQANHPGTTKKQAGDLISNAGFEVAMAAMVKAIKQAMPEAKPGEKAADPPKDQGGTG